jgi:hypothetical protein
MPPGDIPSPVACLTVEGVDRARFETELRPLARPILMKGLVAEWPAVQAAQQSPQAVADYLKAFDAGLKTPVSVLPAQSGGLYFYDETLAALNYRTVNQFLPDIIDRLIERRDETGGESLYMQSLPVEMFLPRFVQDNRMWLLDDEAPPRIWPRIWIGNRLTIQTHYDQSDNLACVIAGRRRFTLFPPDQLQNLYPGRDDFTPGGTPVSMASLDNPDFERFPRLAEALSHAQVAEMKPGDVLYIPYGWWHRVESLSGFNALVNYWWNEADPALISPKIALKAALLAVRALPPEQRAVWKSVFDYYIFETAGDPMAHLPQDARGSFGDLTPELIKSLKDQVRAGVK